MAMMKVPVSPDLQVPAGHVRVGTLQALPGVIRNLGSKPESVLGPFGLTEEYLTVPGNMLPIRVACGLLHLAARKTRCEHFALLGATSIGANSLGPGGKAMRLAKSVGESLAIFRTYMPLHNRHAIVRVGRQGSDAFLGYSLLDGNFPGIQEHQDGAMAVAVNLMRMLVGTSWKPKEVCLMRRTPAEPEIYSRFFGAPCHFNAKCSQLVFPAATLELPLACSDTPTAESIETTVRLASFDELATEDWIILVRRLTLELVLNGNCSRQAVATSLSISPRTLNRKLAQAGASFQELADYSRFTASRSLVGETDMPLGEVARTMDYTNPSAFCRAFKRWTGVSPQTWRDRSTILP